MDAMLMDISLAIKFLLLYVVALMIESFENVLISQPIIPGLQWYNIEDWTLQFNTLI